MSDTLTPNFRMSISSGFIITKPDGSAFFTASKEVRDFFASKEGYHVTEIDRIEKRKVKL